jgi:23S rRNA (guanosine2251-2'-O)-methyltransferase
MAQNTDMLYGRRPVIEAIKSEKTFDKLFVQKNLSGELANEFIKLAKENKVVLTKVPIEKLNRLTRKNHQGVVGFISPISFANIDHIVDQTFSEGRDPLILVLDRITDVRNFGAIVRSAECVGVDAVIIPSRGAAQISADAMKTSAGALNLVPICRANNVLALLKSLQQSGLTLIAATEKSNATLYEAPFSQPLAIIMGSEESGIDSEILAVSDYKVKIPLSGALASLNVATATGIFLYEAVRQRKYSKL